VNSIERGRWTKHLILTPRAMGLILLSISLRKGHNVGGIDSYEKDALVK
jgi:hypothetical protein